MSYTNYGLAVHHGGKKLSKGYATYGEAYAAACRIAATKDYAYTWKALFSGKWRTAKLATNWAELQIREYMDYGGGPSYKIRGRISREEAEAANAEPYRHADNVKRLRRPRSLPRTFEKNGEAYRFREAVLDYEGGLAVEYETQNCVYSINKDYADKWKPYGMSRALFEEIERAEGYNGER